MSEAIKKRLPLLIVAIIFVVLIGVFVWKSNIKEEKFDWASYADLTLSEQEKTTYQEAADKLSKNNNDADSLLSLARLRDYGGDPEGALRLYEKVLEQRPQDIVILNNMAVIYYSIGEYEQAEGKYQQILAVTPKWTNAYRELVNLYRYKLTDKYSTVPELLQKGFDATPEAKEDFYALFAVYYEDVDDLQQAIEYYNKVLEVNPNNTGAASALDSLWQRLQS
ncbi:tetratricopeptide repeat protein [Candidatus Falkowbacteria bacterium]|nr:tetratricopeptide repeat protein [Candidatus Falkowbacteria bacterium]